ncbi:hypothetical protein BOX15_Mlig017277g1 [Macrostomum lignano]|uniref:Uncharacterized protein n=1 Tax=Macrostomum lignano TaxID=282301 RepID=A0A267FT80_9PLAT|nr:hypothetical protein BOX15_Mlig017277g1 [Macrostomum lignano]
MATYTSAEVDGLPSIHRPKPREVWKFDDEAGDSATKARQMYELQDQLRSQREELRRRDEVIRELTNRDPAGGSGVWAASAAVNGVGATSALLEHGHCGITACPSARSEVAALRVKVDGLQAKLREKQLELDSALESAQRHRAEADRLREDNARQLALNAELSRQIDCCEATRGSYEEVKSRSGQAVFELQEQLRRAQDRTRDLEAKLADRDVRDAGRSSAERRLTEFAANLAYHLEVSESASLDTLINRASSLAQEAATLRARSRSQEEQLAAHEAEARANRETIQRLLAEVNREHRLRPPIRRTSRSSARALRSSQLNETIWPDKLSCWRPGWSPTGGCWKPPRLSWRRRTATWRRSIRQVGSCSAEQRTVSSSWPPCSSPWLQR